VKVIRVDSHLKPNEIRGKSIGEINFRPYRARTGGRGKGRQRAMSKLKKRKKWFVKKVTGPTGYGEKGGIPHIH